MASLPKSILFAYVSLLVCECLLSSSIRNTSSISETGESFYTIFSNSTNPITINATGETPRQNKLGILHTLQNLTEWSIREETIVPILLERLIVLRKEYRLLTSFVYDYKEVYASFRGSRLPPASWGNAIGSSAILSHRMTWRYVGIIQKIRELLQSINYRNTYRNVKKILETSKDFDGKGYSRGDFGTMGLWPGLMDKFMSLTALLHLQDVYQLSPAVIRHGKPFDTLSPGHLSIMGCAELAVFALRREIYTIAVQWFEFLLMNEEENVINEFDSSGPRISNELLLTLLTISTQKQNFMEHMQRIKANFVDQRSNEKQNRSEFYSGSGVSEEVQTKQYIDLCLGNVAQTLETQKVLKCYYETQQHPYLTINPIKVEVLSEEPRVLQFYEVINNSTIAKIKRIAAPGFALSNLIGDQKLESTTTVRTSVGVSMPDTEILEFHKFSSVISGLTVQKSEGQVVEYAYGRFYDFHVDAANTEVIRQQESLRRLADRLATLLFYMETPVSGGVTPFLEAGIFVKPVRGSAVLWYNLYRNGTTREDINHGSCPVIHGHKMIINYWLRYSENFGHFKCSLNQFE